MPTKNSNVTKKVHKNLEKEALSVKLSFKYFFSLPVIIIIALVLIIMYNLGYLQSIF
jgi:hypothetical protein